MLDFGVLAEVFANVADVMVPFEGDQSLDAFLGHVLECYPAINLGCDLTKTFAPMVIVVFAKLSKRGLHGGGSHAKEKQACVCVERWGVGV